MRISIVVQEHTKECPQNGITGQETKMRLGENGYRRRGCGQKNQWVGPVYTTTWRGWEPEVHAEFTILVHHKCPVWTEAVWLEDDIIYSRISGAS